MQISALAAPSLQDLAMPWLRATPTDAHASLSAVFAGEAWRGLEYLDVHGCLEFGDEEV
jgi:hypothetical protein